MSKDNERLLLLVDEEIVRESDGFFYFWPSRTHGALSSHNLRTIASELDKRNEPAEKAIEEYFEGKK